MTHRIYLLSLKPRNEFQLKVCTETAIIHFISTYIERYLTPRIFLRFGIGLQSRGISCWEDVSIRSGRKINKLLSLRMTGVRFGIKLIEVLYKLDMTIVAGMSSKNAVQLIPVTMRKDRRFIWSCRRIIAKTEFMENTIMSSLMNGIII